MPLGDPDNSYYLYINVTITNNWNGETIYQVPTPIQVNQPSPAALAALLNALNQTSSSVISQLFSGSTQQVQQQITAISSILNAISQNNSAFLSSYSKLGLCVPMCITIN